MVNTKFEAYKIKREIKRSGRQFTFVRTKRNDYKEPDKKLGFDVLGALGGLYHEQSSMVSVQTNETTQSRTKKIPAILCLWEDVQNLQLQFEDVVKINDKVFKITAVENVAEWSIIADISLEVLDYVVEI